MLLVLLFPSSFSTQTGPGPKAGPLLFEGTQEIREVGIDLRAEGIDGSDTRERNASCNE